MKMKRQTVLVGILALVLACFSPMQVLAGTVTAGENQITISTMDDAALTELKETLKTAVQQRTEELDVSGYDLYLTDYQNGSIDLILQGIFYELYGWQEDNAVYVRGCSYNTVTGRLGKLTLYHKYSDADIAARQKAIAIGIDVEDLSGATAQQIEEMLPVIKKILSDVEEDMTDLEKVIVIHNYIVKNCKYDYDNYLTNTVPSESFQVYGVLVNKIAVCDGYAKTMCLLLKALGIETLRMVSSPMCHAWNLVKLDGSWYHIDATWDDPVMTNGGSSLGYDYFLKSDTKMETDLEHYSWLPDEYTADSTLYDDYYWNEITGELYHYNGAWYYCYGNNLVKSDINRTTDSIQVLKSVDTPMGSTFYNGVYYYYTCYRTGDTEYLQTIYKIDLDTLQKEEILSETKTGEYMTGINVSSGKLEYNYYNPTDKTVTSYEKAISTSKTYVLGDPSKDGIIDIFDIQVIQKHILEINILENEDFTAADINKDNVVDIYDIQKLQRHILEIELIGA